MEENKMHFRHLMLFYFRKGKNAAQTAKKICIVYGDSAVAESTVRKWFTRFKNGNFDLEDRERSGRPAVVDDDQILTLIENNPRHTTRDIADILHISHMTVIRHLKTHGIRCQSDFSRGQEESRSDNEGRRPDAGRGAVAAGGSGGDQRREKARARSESVRAADQHEPGHLSEPDHAGGPAVLRGIVGRRFRHRRQSARRHVKRG